WLSNLRAPIEEIGNKKDNAFGNNMPSNDGPRKIPAIISPMTGGCPILRKRRLINLAAIIITITCKSRILRGSRRRSCNTLPMLFHVFSDISCHEGEVATVSPAEGILDSSREPDNKTT